jgi:DNA-directed RNA polymerase specialized sigma24 family protein
LRTLYTRTDAGVDFRDTSFYITSDDIGDGAQSRRAAYLYGVTSTIPEPSQYREATDDEAKEYNHKHMLVWGIVGEYFSLFYHLAAKYSPNDIDGFVSDIAIPAALRCCRDYDLSIGTASFTNLYRAIQGAFYNKCRSEKSRKQRETGRKILQTDDLTDKLELLQKVLAKIPQYHRYVLTLYYLHGCSYSDMMLCSKGGVRNKLKSAIACCRRMIDNEIGAQKYVD